MVRYSAIQKILQSKLKGSTVEYIDILEITSTLSLLAKNLTICLNTAWFLFSTWVSHNINLICEHFHQVYIFFTRIQNFPNPKKKIMYIMICMSWLCYLRQPPIHCRSAFPPHLRSCIISGPLSPSHRLEVMCVLAPTGGNGVKVFSIPRFLPRKY